MRLCVPIPCFFADIGFEEAIKEIESLGFDACEIYDWKNLDLAKAERAIKESPVELISMCTSEFRLTDPAFRESWLDGLRESVGAAKRLGATKLITQVGADTGEARKTQHENIVETLKMAGDILSGSGVTLMIEPLNILVDHPGYYLTSASEAFDIIREVGLPEVKAVYDIYHQQISEGNIIPTICENLDLIAHLHAAGHPGRIELQMGESDYKNIFRSVDEAGYRGACGLEYHPTLDPKESLRLAKEIFG